MNINTVSPTKEVAAVSGSTLAETAPVSEIKKTEESIQDQAIEKKQQKAAPVEEIKELADSLNEYMDDLQTDLGFSINDKLNHQVIVEIKNRSTNELIKQIPSEELVAIREKMAELTGLLLDKSV